MGDELRRFMHEIMERGDATGRFKVHFASAREVFNMIVAAVEGKSGDPGQYRDYRLQPIWKERDARRPGQGKLNYANAVK